MQWETTRKREAEGKSEQETLLETDKKDKDKGTEMERSETDKCRDREDSKEWAVVWGASGYRRARQTEGTGRWQGHLGERKGTSQTEGNGH